MLTSIFKVAAMAVASCTLVHIGFGLFGMESIFHFIGDEYNLFNLADVFGIESHAHGMSCDTGLNIDSCGSGVHDHSSTDGFDDFLNEFNNE